MMREHAKEMPERWAIWWPISGLVHNKQQAIILNSVALATQMNEPMIYNFLRHLIIWWIKSNGAPSSVSSSAYPSAAS